MIMRLIEHLRGPRSGQPKCKVGGWGGETAIIQKLGLVPPPY